jgi:tetratricopeptide (TPR) repeat protein
MPKKKLEETTPIKTSSSIEETKPVRAKRATKNVKPSTVTTNTVSPTFVPEVEPEEGPRKKVKRGKWIWLGILAMLLITAIGIGLGYFSAMQARQTAELQQRLDISNKQFALALNDQAAGNYELAKQRYEYILGIYPDYPGIDQKLVEIGVALAQQKGNTQLATPVPNVTAQPTLSIIVPTVDTKSVSRLLTQAQDQYRAGDWGGLYTTVTSLRDIDPTYEPIKVDGLYYVALRNRGIADVQAGNLEIALYDFALAEDIAPIDADAQSYRSWAIMYLNAGSWWSVNWQNAVDQFASLYNILPNLMDSSHITVTERYARALIGYGDSLQQAYDWCNAVPQYEKSRSIYAVPGIDDIIVRAQEYCASPPPTPTPTVDPYAPTPTPEE